MTKPNITQLSSISIIPCFNNIYYTHQMIRPSISYNNMLLGSMLAFSILDLYFAHFDTSCTNSTITHTNIGFGLGAWL